MGAAARKAGVGGSGGAEGGRQEERRRQQDVPVRKKRVHPMTGGPIDDTTNGVKFVIHPTSSHPPYEIKNWFNSSLPTKHEMGSTQPKKWGWIQPITSDLPTKHMLSRAEVCVREFSREPLSFKLNLKFFQPVKNRKNLLNSGKTNRLDKFSSSYTSHVEPLL